MFVYKDDMFCECEEEVMSKMPENPKLATAYVPFQHAKCIYSASKGLSQGSIFPDLIMPYKNYGMNDNNINDKMMCCDLKMEKNCGCKMKKSKED